jgi:hypothetical protein
MDINTWMQQLAPWFGICGIGSALLFGGLALRESRTSDLNTLGRIGCVGGYILILFGLAGIVAAAWNFRWPFGALLVIMLILAAVVVVIACLRRQHFRVNRLWPFGR